MRRAYDSTNPFDIPASAAIVAGYVDGIYAWSAAGWARFPNAVHVRIACFATTNDGHVLDVETGDATPQQAPHWVLMRRAAGVDPTVYVNRSNWGATRQAFQSQGIAEPHYWLAAYDNIAEVPPGTVAKQYADSAMAGGHYDLSAVADYWPGVDQSNPNATAGSEVLIGDDMTADQEAKLDKFIAWVETTEGAQMLPLLQAIAPKLDAFIKWVESTEGTQLVPLLEQVKAKLDASPSPVFPPLNISLTGTAKP